MCVRIFRLKFAHIFRMYTMHHNYEKREEREKMETNFFLNEEYMQLEVSECPKKCTRYPTTLNYANRYLRIKFISSIRFSSE